MEFIEEELDEAKKSEYYNQKLKELNDTLWGDFDSLPPEEKKKYIRTVYYDASPKYDVDKKKWYLAKIPKTPIGYKYYDTDDEDDEVTDTSWQKWKHPTEKNKEKYDKRAKAIKTKKYIHVPLEVQNFLTVGNAKIPSDTMILNMNAALRCPSRKFCAVVADCYAIADEVKYSNTLERDLRNGNMFDMAEYKDKLDLIFELIEIFAYDMYEQGHRINYLRLSEAGDFKSIKVLEKFDEYAGKWKNGFEIDIKGQKCYVPPFKVAAYTAQNDLGFVDAFKNVKNISFCVSLPSIVVGDNTVVKKAFEALPAEKYDKLEYTPLLNGEIPLLKKSKEFGTWYYKCPCGQTGPTGLKKNCSSCRVCFNSIPGYVEEKDELGQPKYTKRRIYTIYEGIHGQGKSKSIPAEIEKKKYQALLQKGMASNPFKNESVYKNFRNFLDRLNESDKNNLTYIID